MKTLSPRQKTRLKVQKRVLEDLDDVALAFDLGIENGLSGSLIDRVYPDATILGVEIDEETADNADPDVYDEIYHADAIDFLVAYAHQDDPAVMPDIVICAELIEHYHKEAAELLLEALEFYPFVILTTPIGFMKQGALNGNPYQIHRSGWTPEEFYARGWRGEYVNEKLSLGIYTWSLK